VGLSQTGRGGLPGGFSPEAGDALRLRVIFPRELDRWIARSLEIIDDSDDLGRAPHFSAALLDGC
jgi:hypothetical protein